MRSPMSPMIRMQVRSLSSVLAFSLSASLLLFFLFYGMRERKKEVATYLLIIVLILFSFRIMARNRQWGDPVKFYTNELAYTETSARIYANLGMELSDTGDCVSAIPNYEKAILISDVYPQTHHNLARCLEAMEDFDGAQEEYLKALDIEPNFPYSINALRNLQ